jgi:hypothetical protein
MINESTSTKYVKRQMMLEEEPAYSRYSCGPEANPSQFIFLPKKSIQRLGLYFLILTIVGLILSFILPWVLVPGGDIFGNNLLKNDEIFEGFTASSDINIASAYYYQGVDMVFTSYYIILILAIMLVVTGIIQSNFKNTSRYLAIINISLSFIVFIIGTMTLIGTLRLISLHLLIIPASSQFNFDNTSIVAFPAAYTALIFGILFIKKSFTGVRLQYALLEPKLTPRTPPQAIPQTYEGGPRR